MSTFASLIQLSDNELANMKVKAPPAPEAATKPDTSEPDDESSSYENSSVVDDSEYDSSYSGLNSSHYGEDSTIVESEKSRKSNGDDFNLATNKTKAVNRSKVVVYLIITIAAAVVGATTYSSLHDQETANFENAVSEYSTEIARLVNLKGEGVVKHMDSFCSILSSFTEDMGSVWPEVNIPHFEVHGLHQNDLTGALQVAYAPLVTDTNRDAWEAFSVANQDWIQEGNQFTVEGKISDHIFRFADGDSGEPVVQTGPGIAFGPGNYAPLWQQSPAPQDPSNVNFDLLSHPIFGKVYKNMFDGQMAAISEVADLEWFLSKSVEYDPEEPVCFILNPLFSTVHDSSFDHLVGFTTGVIPWYSYFQNILHKGADGVVVVLHDSCTDDYSYQINGPDVEFLGKGDLHDPSYSSLGLHSEFEAFPSAGGECSYDFSIYPSKTLEDEHRSNTPGHHTIVVIFVFVVTAFVFAFYDFLVSRRHQTVLAAAKKSTAVVSSLFPKVVRDRILQDAENNAASEQDIKSQWKGHATQGNLRNFLSEGDQAQQESGSKPIADLFPRTTIMFADIVGFTAWSSVREPTQVFTLLETLYAAFDEIAHKRKVFKVETVGDCYVAVTGLPEPRKDHAVIMARFARDCLHKTNQLTKKLEVELGPDTSDLCMRIGLHSGPVTAGVLRGEKSRFQLFGDTMNTTARVETTGAPNKIHLSSDTANLLIEAGKESWVTPREEKVQAKGKGELETYWLNAHGSSGGTSDRSGTDPSNGGTSSGDDQMLGAVPENAAMKPEKTAITPFNDRQERLIGWNVDILLRLLKELTARRAALDADNPNRRGAGTQSKLIDLEMNGPGEATMVFDEVQEVIELPGFNANAYQIQRDADEVQLPFNVEEEVRDYVRAVAACYRDNPFHNFEHASHVTMSTVKLLSRIVSPDQQFDESGEVVKDIHFGISTDPLTRFSCVFSALIHDLDHTGVPNNQLIKEGRPVARAYHNKSVAEQNSVNLAWNLLMDDKYRHFRRTIYSTTSGFMRFRRLVVNSVMATDIMDKDLKAIRNGKWDKAFKEIAQDACSKEAVNRKATIVIEHLIQASDIAHTMQHWHVYTKWNERFFQEMYKAYKCGRADSNPIDNWYKGEIGFFDFYIIPLAKKLKQCGVFGVSSDEYLNYALKNRKEWEARGQELVAKYVENLGDQA